MIIINHCYDLIEMRIIITKELLNIGINVTGVKCITNTYVFAKRI